MSELREFSSKEMEKIANIFNKMAEKAATDKDFKDLCLSDTAEAFKKFTGAELPDSINVEFVKEGEECSVIDKQYVPIPLKDEGGISNDFADISELFKGNYPLAKLMYMPAPPRNFNNIGISAEVVSVNPQFVEPPIKGKPAEVKLDVKISLSRHPFVVLYMAAPPDWKVPDIK